MPQQINLAKFSIPFLHIECPKNVIFLFLIVSSSLRFMLAIISTRSFVTLSVHEIFSIYTVS